MGFTERDKAAVKAILSVFETGSETGNPAALAVLDDGAGISYGLHQATHRAGSLERVVRKFAELAPAHQASALKWAQALADRSAGNIRALGRNAACKQWLRQAAATPEMVAAQEIVFDEDYMQPAVRECERIGFVEPLSLAVVYDSFVQGSWSRCRERTNGLHKAPVGEMQWIADYLNVREAFLRGLPSQSGRNSVYRPQAFRDLIQEKNWRLETPFTVRGRMIEEHEL